MRQISKKSIIYIFNNIIKISDTRDDMEITLIKYLSEYYNSNAKINPETADQYFELTEDILVYLIYLIEILRNKKFLCN